MRRWFTPGVSAVAITLIIAATILAWRALDRASQWVGDFTGMFGVTQSVSTTLQNALGELQHQGGLVVGWREINTHLRRDRESAIRAFGYSLPLGSVHIILEVPGNRAQYIIPANNDWTAESFGDLIVITAPPPIVNDKVVEVQSDPSKMRLVIDNDWMEHLIPSGGDIDEAKRMIRASVVETASSGPALAEVRVEARRAVERFCSGIFGAVAGPTPRILVQFSDEVSFGPGTDFPK